MNLFDYIYAKKVGGGGGSGGKNAYCGSSAPTSSDGENGDYWFELLSGGTGIKSGSLTGKANTGIAGWEFTASEAAKVIGLRAYARSSYTGTIKFGTLNGVLVEKSVDVVANQWASVSLDAPINLTPGEHYIVMFFGTASTLSYNGASSLTFNSSIAFVNGRYGGYPGSTESGNVYSADVVIEGAKPWPFVAQYYKENGTWSLVP